jgi:(+)-trans-carveol dehydrogenase
MDGSVGRRFENKVVLISGVARGQGREHALEFAKEGARIVGFDICEEIASSQMPLSTVSDLEQTEKEIKSLGASAHLERADVRDYDAVERVVTAAVDKFGPIDVVIGNAGILAHTGPLWETGLEDWHDTIAVNLSGVWHTAKAAIPTMIEGAGDRSIVVIGSTAATKGWQNIGPYVAAKHGLVGLMRTMAQELAEHGIRVNMVSPTNVATSMFINDKQRELFAPGLENPTEEQFEEAVQVMNMLPVGWIQPSDVTAAIRWVVSEEARYVTGAVIPVDAGCTAL